MFLGECEQLQLEVNETSEGFGDMLKKEFAKGQMAMAWGILKHPGQEIEFLDEAIGEMEERMSKGADEDSVRDGYSELGDNDYCP